MGNVELFELCESTPRVQCSQCLLHWNQGLVHCICGHFLVESESSRKFNKLSLDALSIPHYVIKKGRLHGAQHCKTEEPLSPSRAWRDAAKEFVAQEEHYKGIHDRFLRDEVHRESQLKIGWTEQKCIEMDKCGTGRSYIPSIQRGIQEIPRTVVSHIWINWSKNAPMRLRSDFRAAVSIKNRLHRESGRRSCTTHFSSTTSEMAPFFLKRFLVELGHVQKLVELMKVQFFELFVAVGFVYSW